MFFFSGLKNKHRDELREKKQQTEEQNQTNKSPAQKKITAFSFLKA